MQQGDEQHKTHEHHSVHESGPDSFDQDLHGQNRAGQHASAHGNRTFLASDVKDLYEKMPDFHHDELKRIPILMRGERLEQGGVYLDLNDPTGGPFTAKGSMEAGDEHLYVPKALVDYALWNKLTKTG